MKYIAWTISFLLVCSIWTCTSKPNIEASILNQINERYGLSGYDTVYILPNSNKCIHCIRRFYQQLSKKVDAPNNFFWVCPHPSDIDLSAFWKKKNVHLAYKEDACNSLEDEIQLLILDNGEVQTRLYGDITNTGELVWLNK